MEGVPAHPFEQMYCDEVDFEKVTLDKLINLSLRSLSAGKCCKWKNSRRVHRRWSSGEKKRVLRNIR